MKNRFGGLSFVNWLASKAGGIHSHVGGNHHHVRVVDVLSGQDVLSTRGTLRFHFDTEAHQSGSFFKSLSSHQGMGDARWAGSDCNDLFHMGKGIEAVNFCAISALTFDILRKANPLVNIYFRYFSFNETPLVKMKPK